VTNTALSDARERIAREPLAFWGEDWMPVFSRHDDSDEFKSTVTECHSRESGNRAPESAFGQRGGSPLQVRPLRPVTDCNCVAVRRGGEQQEVNDQSVG
jgi:hypothetical protein